MAKFQVLGNAGVLTSTLKLNEIKTVEKYRPEKLIVKGGEDGKDEIFRIGTGSKGHMSKYGMTFADESREEGFATITVGIDEDGSIEELKEKIADELGMAFIHLGELEEKLPAVLREIEEQKRAMMSQISIA